jgi:hydrogenase/urease accessory protein HupE
VKHLFYCLSSLFVLFCAVLLPHRADAHPLQVEPVAIEIRAQDSFFAVVYKGNVQDITQIPGYTLGSEERIGDRFPKPFEEALQKYINEKFLLQEGENKIAGTITDLRYEPGVDVTKARFHLAMRYERGADKGKPLTLWSSLFDYLPNALTTVTVGGFQRNFKPGDPPQTVDPSNTASNLFTNVVNFLKEGCVHIFQGPDHILFILALLMVSTSLKSLIKTLTGFTVAHSITLILSTLNIITLNPRLVDILVAVSIIYVGAENIFAKNLKHRFWIASGFGLVHGMAFAQNLRDIGLPEGNALFWSLLSFNLGVEAAQVIICCLAFPLMMIWKTSTEKRAAYGGMSWETVVKFASIGVIIAGGYWLMQRAFG